MSLRLDFSYARWLAQARLMQARLGQDQAPFLRQQFRLLLVQLIRFTPPRSLSQGRKRVAIDLAKVVSPFDAARLRNQRLRAIVRGGDTEAFNAFAAAARMRARAVDPSQIPALHARARDSRGRVRRGQRPVFVLGRRATAAYRSYVRRKQNNVGIARAGWAPALEAGGGNVPGWVARHGRRFGTVEDHSARPRQPEMIARNRAPWASRRDEGPRILANALDARRRDMERNLKILLQKSARGAGLAA